MHKGKIFALVGMAVLGGALYFTLQAQAQTLVPTIKDDQAVCRPTKYYPIDPVTQDRVEKVVSATTNGYTESYVNPNNCHSRRIMFGLAGAFTLDNCGAGPWCSWKVRCPAGATVKSHSGAHYWMSPTMGGYYDGGPGGSGHSYCVDTSGYQVDPIPGESDTNPYHTHSTKALAKVDVVGSDADYYWSYSDNSWMTCSGGASGPYPEDGEAKANHFHCKNPNFSTASLNDGVYDERDNPEAQPTTGGGPVGDMQSIVGSSGFSTYGTTASTNSMLDTVANQNLWMSPAGTVRCVSANSNSVYFSTDGACPPASQFPAKPPCTLSLSFANGKTSYVKGENVNYTYTCTPTGTRASNATVQVVQPNGTASTYVTGTNIDTATLGFETTNLAAGTYTLRVCVDPNCAPSATSSMSSLQFTVTESVTTTAIPAAPTNLTAAYSTANLGQREVVLTVTDNATNETYNQLYWHLTGTAWPSIAPKDTYDTSSSTWSQPANVGRIQIFAPTAAGTYEYKLQACNASGCSSSNIVSVTVPSATTTPTTTSDTPATVVMNALSQYGANKYSIKVNDADGIKEFLINKASGAFIYSGSPGASGNVGTCSGTSTFKTIDSGTVTLESSDFPLQASVTDCRTGAAAYTFSVPSPGTTATTNQSNWVNHTWTFSDGGTQSSYILNRTDSEYTSYVASIDAQCRAITRPATLGWMPTPGDDSATNWRNFGIPVCSGSGNGTTTPTTTSCSLNLSFTNGKTSYAKGEFVNYTYSCSPAGSRAANATVQVVKPDGTATTYNSATNIDTSSMGFDTLNLAAGTYTLRVCIDPNCATTSSMSSLQFTVTVSATSPRSCATGEKCPSGSWCNNGAQCYYPDSQMTCVAWSTSTTDTWAAPMSSVSCPAGTTACNPTDANCVEKGQTVPYSSGKWCSSGSQQYYSKDGTKMTCIAMNASTPAGYTSCRPDDTNCIPEESYGPSGGWCSRGMKCNQKVTDTNPKNDVYCTKMIMGPNPESPSCPAGYGSCSPGEVNCKEKGDSWTGTDSSYYCTNAQKCTTATGGTCVGWNESCPAGSKYCSASDTNCVEPGETKAITGTNGGGYWCGGGGGMVFYSSTKAYCEKKANTTTMAGMMWTAAEIKAILTKLGAGWGLCRSGDSNCIEPGKTGSSSGWCAWMSPGSYSPMNDNGPRTCPALDGTTTAPPVPVTPPTVPGEPTPVPVPVSPGERECGPGEIPGPTNYCMMPMYRWNVTTKAFEKCPAFGGPMATAASSMNSAANQTTSCEPMNYEIEKEWRMEKYTVHPPEKDGQWYMPPWDAATPMLQYDLKTDQLGSCDTRANTATIAVKPGEMPPYFSPCMPVPEIDKGWMLKKFRAEYRMYKLYAAQNAGVATPVPVKPGEEPTPILPIEVIKPPVRPVVPAQCKMYLLNIKQGIITDKKFWKDVSRQVKQAPKEYPDLEDVNKILGDSKTILVEIEKLARANKCDTDTLTDLQDKQDTLHSDYFSELSIYLPDMQDFVQYEQCRLGLDNQVKRLQGFLKNDLNDETKASVKELIDATVAKLAEFKNQVTDFEYDAGFECEDYSDELTNQVSPLLMVTDKEINRIVEQVVQTKFQPVIAELTARLEEKGQKIEELLVRVAELHKTVEAISQTATKISDSIATSYNALTYIEEKYAEQKTQIEEAKDKLLPVIQKAMEVIKTARCLKGGDKDRMVQEFGELASVNWIGARGDELNKRAQLFISSCAGKDFSKTDVDEFIKNVDEAARQNQQASYQAGLTPFPDVPTHEWYFGPMLTASKEGIMTQGRPAENVLKQDALLMVLRATGAPEKEISTEEKCVLSAPSVTAVSPYANCAVNYAAKHGVSFGGSLTIPGDRAEVATWLVKLANLPAAGGDVLNKYTDLAGATAAEKKAIASIVSSGIMVGNVDGEKAIFNPDSSLVRAELAKIIERLSSRE